MSVAVHRQSNIQASASCEGFVPGSTSEMAEKRSCHSGSPLRRLRATSVDPGALMTSDFD
jgi:hypothetical protein